MTDPFEALGFPSLPHKVEWGLDRIRALLSEVGDPHLAVPSLHVGGTNGKGSVAASWAAVLAAAGRRVGLYTSPHLCDFRERIRIDGRPVAPEVLAAAADLLRGPVERHRPSFFEAATALGFVAFARSGVDVSVIEVGLGGRLDATNVVAPLVTAVTNVAMDHADYLGDTLDAIAREKAGIVKPGVPFHTAEEDPSLRAIFREVAASAGAPFHAIRGDDDLRDVSVGPGGTGFTVRTRAWGLLELTTPLVGEHQAVNAALAVRALGELPGELRPARDTVVRGLASVDWPGRVQIEEIDGVRWVFDVAHNTAGVHVLARTLGRLDLPRPLVVVTGILGDKDWRAMLPPLFSLADRAVLTQPPSAPEGRRWHPREVADLLGPPPPPLEVVEDFAEALEKARSGAAGGTVVVTGSCHTVGDALRALALEPCGPGAGHGPRRPSPGT